MSSRTTTKTFFALGLLIVVIGLTAIKLTEYLNSPTKGTPLVYSNNALLHELWADYKANVIEPGSHRTLDKSQENITTSEGQSYTMLRAVWMDDKETFDKSWDFTINNMQRKDDKLIAWKYGQKPDKTYGILDHVGGNNTASDADTDIALALIMAYSRWNQTSYLYQAKDIINSVWEKEVAVINGKPVLLANDIEKNSQTTVVVNPSYFSPYSYRLFSKIDPKHDWMGLVNSSYEIINQLSDSSLGSQKNSGLPPNWISMDRKTGNFIPNERQNLDTNYGYDAMRTPWRIAMDHTWYNDPRAEKTLKKFRFLSDEWNNNSELKTIYSKNEDTVAEYESPSMYGTAIGYFKVADKQNGDELYEQKLQTLYSPDKQKWKEPLGYYEDNWAWFGIALHQNALPNLAEDIN